MTGVEIKSEAHFWVITLDEFGNIERKDWKTIYNSIRDKLGVPFPGYVLHEAINWSPHLNRYIHVCCFFFEFRFLLPWM